ncbi:peptidylprolyl isomerase [Candidatus Gottesmanbacteria bacterium RIFCSPLOWO2_01_FULL_39_12b]|uniref:Peptidyl-prolyl cis-trans isomerase n=1 Tax=Candidatus Gottesmanbacteria bacterium RIFCSPLOWO2_01_FULL_39_12b TaxID=1798388 RepID=A0A1F6ARQ6_9BACT|nr:MAG: peptidylprolyl isomerase [Candidatus Gottesmanbacteria bacterium RIFCSPLOWO2_01_FULL_39_12b]
MTIDSKKVYKGQITTNKGLFTIELFAKETPVTVNNFVALAKDGFYNNTVFHRIIKDFMIQGGDPKGDGTGGPGYTFADEKITRDYKRGIVAMANSGPNTNGSQFFIVHKDTDVPKNYVIFGQVLTGMETIDKIAGVKVEDNGRGEQSKPTETVKIEKIEITVQ